MLKRLIHCGKVDKVHAPPLDHSMDLLVGAREDNRRVLGTTVRVATNGLVSVLQGMARQRLRGTIKRLCTFRSKLGMRIGELAAFAVHARDAYTEEYCDALMGRNRDGIGTLVCVGEYNGDPWRRRRSLGGGGGHLKEWDPPPSCWR